MLDVDTCTAGEAVDRAMRLLHRCEYQLGAGDYLGLSVEVEQPVVQAFDCCGFAVSYCWKVKRHRPGFNRASGAHATIVDDLNVDSVWEDAFYGAQEFGVALARHEPPRPGDLLITRSIRRGQVKHAPDFCRMGHVRICTKAPLAWDASHPKYVSLEMAEIDGPNGNRGPILCSGQPLDNWNRDWPTPEFCVVVVRPHERV